MLSSGGTPTEIAALLDAYANLINAFNGSDGGKAIMAEVAKKLASIPAGLLVVQTQALAQSTGTQLAALQSLGGAEKSNILGVIDDVMKNNSGRFTAAVYSLLQHMRSEYDKTSDPVKRATILKNIENATKLREVAHDAASAAILSPFRDANGNIAQSPESMVEAIVELHQVNKIEAEDLDPARGNR